MVRHLPFIDALAHAPSEDWDTLKVGYLLMRVFDDWIRCGPELLASGDSRLKAIIADIDRIPPRYVAHARACRAVITALVSSADVSRYTLAVPVVGYASLLSSERRWLLAADVYQTASAALGQQAATEPAEWELLAQARLRGASALRKAGELDEAVLEYTTLSKMAKTVGLPLARMQAFIGIGNILRARGNLPKAERLFSVVMNSAEALGSSASFIYADALHARGSLRHGRGKHEHAIRDLFMAYERMQDQATRELILTDLGVCAGDAGYRSAAVDALTVIADTGSSFVARTIATVNLIELSVIEGNEDEFKRRCLAWEDLYSGSDPNTRAFANVYIARGAQQFAGYERAEQMYGYAISEAKRMRVHQAEFLAINELDALQRASETKVPELAGYSYSAARPVPDELADIGRALAGMSGRSLALA